MDSHPEHIRWFFKVVVLVPNKAQVVAIWFINSEVGENLLDIGNGILTEAKENALKAIRQIRTSQQYIVEG